MTTYKSISIPAVIYAMLQELTDKNHKKSDQYFQELIKREYEKKRYYLDLSIRAFEKRKDRKPGYKAFAPYIFM